MSSIINVAIAGIQGYSGQVLMQLVKIHPYLNLVAAFSRQTQVELYQQLPVLKRQNIPVYSYEFIKQHPGKIDVLFLATPAAVSIEIADLLINSLINSEICIIDLSGGFRLSEQQFSTWYGLKHRAPSLIEKACYGLTPWVTSQASHRLIANPGCYATCALISLLPLLKANILNQSTLIIDAKSGVSGSGKQTNPHLMFCEMANNFLPYKIGNHQHIPEIKNALKAIGGKDVTIRLTTSLLPIARGITMNIYGQAPVGLTDTDIIRLISQAYQDAYHDYPFVHYQAVGQETIDNLFILSLNQVIGTPNCHIGFFVQDGQITLFASLDNLLKGAASQAIENLNALFNLPLHTGLLSLQGGL
ncbi:N-acetyl-gamma-glutamyl-phosphate reductase [Legionella gresilensis]|uniref:N-acetyl-gamma-glutamyl-phosphate reductase n=1 Tax=Legionella gresilensis TaxID=91823 RepID=UPI0010415D03|nr:N-acetyl-gamma-glutamyl-phosphate reductase [Legionella gresilensis]